MVVFLADSVEDYSLTAEPRQLSYFERLKQLHASLSVLPEVLAPASRETSPAAEERIEKLRVQILRDTQRGRLGDYPKLL